MIRRMRGTQAKITTAVDQAVNARTVEPEAFARADDVVVAGVDTGVLSSTRTEILNAREELANAYAVRQIRHVAHGLVRERTQHAL